MKHAAANAYRSLAATIGNEAAVITDTVLNKHKTPTRTGTSRPGSYPDPPPRLRLRMPPPADLLQTMCDDFDTRATNAEATDAQSANAPGKLS